MTQPQTIPDDSLIERNRGLRWANLIATVVLIEVIGFFGFKFVAWQLFDNQVVTLTSSLIGLGVGALINVEVLHRSIINNRTTRSFVTIDTLLSLLGKKDIHINYGPGKHVSFWWERRIPENNINLEEASSNFEFEVQCTDGVLKGRGSFRLRPDMENPVPFLTGVASIADDLEDLIIVEVAKELAQGTVSSGLKKLEEINEHLEKELVKPDSKIPTDFEKRFGIYVGDITIKELLPTEELQRTLGALTEATTIKKGTAIMLGMSMRAVSAALKDKTLSRADYNNARDRFLAVSGNLEGMDIKRYEIDLSAHGIEKETAEALTGLVRQLGPAAVAAFGTKKGGRSKKK